MSEALGGHDRIVDADYEDWLRWWRDAGRADLEELLLRHWSPLGSDSSEQSDLCARYATRIGMSLRQGISATGIADLLATANRDLGVRVNERRVVAVATEIHAWHRAQRHVGPELYDAPGAARLEEDRRQACLPVPGAVILWSCGTPSRDTADVAWQDEDAMLFAWATDDVRVELRLARELPELSTGMEILDGWVGHWRMRCDRTTTPPMLRCSLSGTASDVEGMEQGGEYLHAQTFELGEHRITIGTGDAQLLATRAGISLPMRWEQQLIDAHQFRAADPIHFHQDGLSLQLPKMQAGETCEVYHAVAWQRADIDSESARNSAGLSSGWYSTYVAVDLMGAPPTNAWPPSGEGAWRSPNNATSLQRLAPNDEMASSKEAK